MLIENFNRTIDAWISMLEDYTFGQLCTQPSPGSWSIGQVSMHLIEDAYFYIDQIKQCLVSDEYADKEPTPNGTGMLQNNDFPDTLIEGAPSNAYIKQPVSKEQLLVDMLQLKTTMNETVALILQSPFRGKTKHPGLGYFSAEEWLQFADMHFRHHLRQKKRIDEFLKRSG